MSNSKISLEDMRKTRRLVESIVNFKNNLLLNNLIIQLQRNSTYEGKPVYSITIHSNGQVTYEGIRNVNVIGTQNTIISRDNLNELLNEIQNVYFFSFKDFYGNPGDNSSSGTVTTSISLGNDSKKVVRLENYTIPSGLIQLENFIDRIINSKQWTGTVT